MRKASSTRACQDGGMADGSSRSARTAHCSGSSPSADCWSGRTQSSDQAAISTPATRAAVCSMRFRWRLASATRSASTRASMWSGTMLPHAGVQSGIDGSLSDSETPKVSRKQIIQPPTGIVTLMFTDIVGSTMLRDTLIATHGEGEGNRLYRERILEPHNQRIRELLAKHDGFEVKTNGDSFMVAFARPE